MATIDDRPINFDLLQTYKFIDEDGVLQVIARDFLRDLWRRTGGINNGVFSNTNITESGTTVTLKPGSTFNFAGTWQIDGTTVTIGADELNTLDGIDTTPVDGAVLIGNSGTNKYDSATLTAGTNITIDNAAGSITINGAPSTYVAQAFTAQTSVTVTHNFSNYPVVQVLGSSNEVLIPLTITHSSVNAFTVTFTNSTTGTILATVGVP